MKLTQSKQQLISNSVDDVDPSSRSNDPLDRPLSQIEKTFLLSAERGDCPTVKRFAFIRLKFELFIYIPEI